MTTPAQARDAGLAVAEQAADPRNIAAIDVAIEAAIASGRRFSANDIRAKFPTVSSGLVGARMRSYATRKVDGLPLMVRIGYTPSTLVNTHSHPIAVWISQAAYQSLTRA